MRNRVHVCISLDEVELEILKEEMRKNGFNQKASFFKWLYLRYIREIQEIAAGIAVLFFIFVGPASAGMDFRYMAGYGPALRKETQVMVEEVKARNKEQAQQSYERIQQILRDMPDNSKNAELLAQYQAILEMMRRLAEQSKAVLAREVEDENNTYQQFKRLVSEQGSYVICSSRTTRGTK